MELMICNPPPSILCLYFLINVTTVTHKEQPISQTLAKNAGFSHYVIAMGPPSFTDLKGKSQFLTPHSGALNAFAL